MFNTTIQFNIPIELYNSSNTQIKCTQKHASYIETVISNKYDSRTTSDGDIISYEIGSIYLHYVKTSLLFDNYLHFEINISTAEQIHNISEVEEIIWCVFSSAYSDDGILKFIPNNKSRVYYTLKILDTPTQIKIN